MLPTGIIIAAAGESRRLGQPKQLLPFRGATLLRHAAETALAAKLGPVVIVLGAVADECRETLTGLDVIISFNSQWAGGLGGSIACGMTALRDELLDAVIVMLCDQPAVTPDVLTSLIAEQRRTGAEIVASSYDDTPGPPALFTVPCFPRLLALEGTSGAKSLFAECAGMVNIPFPGGNVDIDEPADISRLNGFPADPFPA